MLALKWNHRRCRGAHVSWRTASSYSHSESILLEPRLPPSKSDENCAGDGGVSDEVRGRQHARRRMEDARARTGFEAPPP